MISKKLKTFIFGILVIFALSFIPSSTQAQTTEPSDDSLGQQEFELKLVAGNQSPINNSVPLTFTVKAEFDSKTAFVRWKGSHDIDFSKKEEVVFSLEKGKTHTFTQTAKANKEGVYRITAEVEAWRSEANYVDSAQVNLQFNDALELVPITDSYKNGKVLWLIARIVMFILAGVAIFFTGKFGYKKFQEWLARD